MKSEVNPVIGAVVVVILLGVVGFFLWKGTGGGSAKPVGAVGNASPFAPGGQANNKGGKPVAGGPGAPGPGSGNPNAPR